MFTTTQTRWRPFISEVEIFQFRVILLRRASFPTYSKISSSNHHDERQDLADATNNIRFLEMEISRNRKAVS
jgi:hypothetical protein